MFSSLFDDVSLATLLLVNQIKSMLQETELLLMLRELSNEDCRDVLWLVKEWAEGYNLRRKIVPSYDGAIMKKNAKVLDLRFSFE